MDKDILAQYTDTRARIKYLKSEIDKLEEKIYRLKEYGCVSDIVSCGKRGHKTMGTVKVTGYNIESYRKLHIKLTGIKHQLENEKWKLLELAEQAETYIAGIENIEIQNILSLHYIQGKTWIQTAFSMNELYENKCYTEDACRQKHNRYFKSNRG